MNRISLQKTLLGVMCAGVLGYVSGEATAQVQPPGNPETTPGTVSPSTEGRNPQPGTPTPGSPTNPTDPTAPANPSAPGTTPEPTERAPSAVRTETDMDKVPLDPADMKQIKTATQKLRTINATEIAAGELAQENGISQEVKDYGRKLVEDHQNADRKLVEFATKHDVILTGSAGSQEATRAGTGTAAAGQPPPAPLDAEGKKALSKLRAAKGDKFDKTFATTMVTGHQKALNLIKTSKEKIKNEEFDSMLSDFQSTFEQHLDHAKQLTSSSASSATTGDEESTRQGRRPASTPPLPDPSLPPSPSMPSPSTPSPSPSPTPTPIP